MHGNMVFSTHYILGTPQQSGGFLVCSVDWTHPIGYLLTARTRDQVAPVYTRVLPINFTHSGGNWLGPTGGDIVTGLPASSLFVYSGYAAVARFITDQKVRVVE